MRAQLVQHPGCREATSSRRTYWKPSSIHAQLRRLTSTERTGEEEEEEEEEKEEEMSVTVSVFVFSWADRAPLRAPGPRDAPFGRDAFSPASSRGVARLHRPS